MIASIVFIAFMAFLIKINKRDEKWWLWFVLLLWALAKCGYELHMFGLLLALGLWKVIKDLFNA